MEAFWENECAHYMSVTGNGGFEYLTTVYGAAIIISVCIKSGHRLLILETTYFNLYSIFVNSINK